MNLDLQVKLHRIEVDMRQQKHAHPLTFINNTRNMLLFAPLHEINMIISMRSHFVFVRANKKQLNERRREKNMVSQAQVQMAFVPSRRSRSRKRREKYT